MADPALIRSLLDAITDDTGLLAELRVERKKMAREIALNPARGREILSGSGNGQSYSVSVAMTYMDRLRLISAALAHYDAGTKPSRTAPIAIS